MQRRSHIFMVLVFSFATFAAHAQYSSSAARSAEATDNSENAKKNAEESFVGRQYWIVPNPKATTTADFFEVSDGGRRSFHSFVVTQSTSFTVSEIVHEDYADFAKVKFSDGKVAFLMKKKWYSPDDRENLFEHEYNGHGEKDESYEYILTAPPNEIAEVARAEKVKSAAVAAAWKARGGVRVGMTKKQALASNWGKPKHINTTTGSYGTHEQWVYDGNNYLYFENGVLTSIQN